MKGRSILAALAACMALLAAPAQAYLFSAVYSFGDSLSDTGNSGLMTERPPLPPDPPYADGRFSNGPVAAERLAQGLGVQLHSYAVGGAMSGTGNADDSSSSSGVLAQVDAFKTHLGCNCADASALYMVLGGSNDFLVALSTLPSSATDADIESVMTIAAQDVLTNMVEAVTELYAAGARQFLLPLIPDIGAAPAVGDAVVSAAVLGFNGLLADTYRAVLSSLPGLSYTIFDTFAAQQALVEDSANNGLNNFSTPCLVVDPQTQVIGPQCSDPDKYFFWDDLHPTARVHALLGDQLLAAVPEPGSLALVAAALAGLLARRQRRVASTV